MLRALAVHSRFAPRFVRQDLAFRRVPRQAVRGAASKAVASMACEVFQFPALGDNYGYLVHDHSTGNTAAVDTPEVCAFCRHLQTWLEDRSRGSVSQAGAIERALAEKGWKLTHILNTHHHNDHTGGNLARCTRHLHCSTPLCSCLLHNRSAAHARLLPWRLSMEGVAALALMILILTTARMTGRPNRSQALKKKYGCQIVGPRADADRIPGIDVQARGTRVAAEKCHHSICLPLTPKGPLCLICSLRVRVRTGGRGRGVQPRRRRGEGVRHSGPHSRTLRLLLQRQARSGVGGSGAGQPTLPCSKLSVVSWATSLCVPFPCSVRSGGGACSGSGEK